jgi:hypothetical protein
MQEAYNRHMAVRPFSFAATGGPTWGPGPHVMQPERRLPSAKKPHRRLRQCHVFSGPSRESEKVNFSEPV